MSEMPRSVSEILAHADDLAARFESYEPTEENATPQAETLGALRAAVIARANAERAVLACVAEARKARQSWAAIGAMMGTTGEAARQRYKDAEQEAGHSEPLVSEHTLKLLTDAGFTPEELREFAGALQFAGVLAQAGHVGPVADIAWTPEKVQAIMQVLHEAGVSRELPAGAIMAGPQIHLRTAPPQAEALPLKLDGDERPTTQAMC